MGEEILDIVGCIEAERKALAEGIDEEIQRIINDSLLDLSVEIPEPQVLVSRDGLPVCTRGNISMVVGLPGARKSFLCTGIAGAFLSSFCIGLRGEIGGGKLLWLDTEQADGHVARIGRRLNRIVGNEENINDSRIKIHRLREYTPDKRRKVMESCGKMYRPDFIVVDGVADLISDANDVSQSTSIVNDLMRISKEYDCHILVVVHANVGSEKARGHLGSEVLRKAETVITVKADGETSKCIFAKTRDKRPSDFCFTITDGLPESVECEEEKPKPTPKGAANDERIRLIIMKGNKTYSSIKDALLREYRLHPSTAEHQIRKALERGSIFKFGDRYTVNKEDKEDELPF